MKIKIWRLWRSRAEFKFEIIQKNTDTETNTDEKMLILKEKNVTTHSQLPSEATGLNGRSWLGILTNYTNYTIT